MTKNGVFLALYLLFLIFINEILALMTWDQIAQNFHWITSVKQSNNIKVRHFLQMSPQVFTLSAFFYYFIRLSIERSIIFAILFGFFSGCFSEMTQLFAPTRIFAINDILWNTYASFYGAALFAMFHFKSFLERFNNLKSLIIGVPFFFFITTSFIFYQSILFVPFGGDDYKILMALKNPQLFNWDYWKFIISHPTNGNVQYRPLSYYASGIILNNFFDLSPESTGLFAVIVLGIIASLFFSLLLKFYNNYSLAVFISICFLIGPWFSKLVVSFRDLFKYSLTLLLMILGLSLIYDKPLKIKNTVSLIMITTFSILCHEGALVFPAVFFIFSNFKNSRLIYKISLFLPTFAYLSMRFFIWGIPQKGFMSLNLSTIDNVIFHHISTIVTLFSIRNYFFGFLSFLFLFLFSLYRIKKDGSLNSLRYWVSLLIILLPFSLLDNHISKSHSIWPAFFVFLIFADFFYYFIFQNHSSRLIKIVGIILFYVGISTTFISGVLEKNRHFDNGQLMKKVYEDLIITFKNKNIQPDQPIAVSVRDDFLIDGYEFKMTAAALAYFFPRHTFIVSSKDQTFKILIKKGYLYVFNSSDGNHSTLDGDDIFNYSHKFEIPSSEMESFAVQPLSGNFIEKYHFEGKDEPVFISLPAPHLR